MQWLFLESGGRLARKPFWFASLFLLAISPWTWHGLVAPLFGFAPWQGGPRIALAVIELLLLWPNIMLIVKRQHDRGHWPWIAWIVAPLIVALEAAELVLGTPDVLEGVSDWIVLPLVFAFLALLLFALVELGMLRGTVGPNAYGPDPLDNSVNSSAV